MTRPAREWKAGDRVRLKGYANRVDKGWAIAVDGLHGKLVSHAGGHRWNVVVRGVGTLEVFESQLRRLVPRKRRDMRVIYMHPTTFAAIAVRESGAKFYPSHFSVDGLDGVVQQTWIRFVEAPSGRRR